MEYRFVTPTRTGKWYPALDVAQKHACAIGAGYYDHASGEFYQYCETQLQVRAEGAEQEEGKFLVA
jgi:hypothetical protein